MYKLSSPLRVLVTRPIEQAKQLASRITTAGWQPIIFPTLVIKHIDVKIPRLTDFDLAIFISANAVTHTLQALQQTWPPQLTIIAIGNATKQQLEQHRLQVDITPQPSNSEALLKHPALQSLNQKKVIIFKGAGGRSLLADTIKQRGAILTELICYQRQAPQISEQQINELLNNQDISVIIITSIESLENLFWLFTPLHMAWLQKIPMLVISKRIAKAAKQRKVRTIIVAENAHNQTIIDTLTHWIEQQREPS